MNDKDFIFIWKKKLSGEGVKDFPGSLLNGVKCRSINLPQKVLFIGNQFFGNYEILNSDGSQFIQVDNYHLAKYLIYSNRAKPASVKIPLDEIKIKEAVLEYEDYLNSLIKTIEADYKKKFTSGNPVSAVNEIFRILNIVKY